MVPMTNKTKHLSSILSLDEGLPFDNATLVTSLLPTYKWYCRFDHRAYHDDDYSLNDITLPPTIAGTCVRRRTEYLAGRIAASKVMDELGHPKFNLLPAKDRSPKWPIGIQGSISHHHNLAVCIGWQLPTTKQSGLGIDIERMIAPSLALKLWRNIVSSAEKKFLETLSIPFFTSLTLAFSAKESLYKALFPMVKSYFNFLDARVVGFTNALLTLELLITFSTHILRWYGF